MKRSVCVFAVLLLLAVSAFAHSDTDNEKKEKQSELVALVEKTNALQLTGLVIDEKNKEALAGAAIVVDGKKYYSDLDGNFSIKDVKPGKYEVMVELISYEPVTLKVNLSESKNLNIGLLQK